MRTRSLWLYGRGKVTWDMRSKENWIDLTWVAKKRLMAWCFEVLQCLEFAVSLIPIVHPFFFIDL